MVSMAIERNRIVVIARPALGRLVSEHLSAAGFEVYRTPSASGMTALHDRIRPHLAIVSVDLLGHDGITAALSLREETHGLPVLLLGEASGDHRVHDLPILSSADATSLLSTVIGMLGARGCTT